MKGSKLTRALFRSVEKIKRASPTILTVISSVGVVGTTILAVRATPKAIRLLEEKERDKHGEIGKLEAFFTVAPTYIPTVVIGGATIACMFGANVLNKRQQASIAGAYALLNGSYKQYKEAAKEVFGEDADKKIQAKKAEKVAIYSPSFANNLNVYDPKDGIDEEELLFYDSFGERYFTSTMAAVLSAEYAINRNLQIRGYVYLGELYDFLGLDRIAGDEAIGWDCCDMVENYDYAWIEFENRLTDLGDGIQCYIVDAVSEPEAIPY